MVAWGWGWGEENWGVAANGYKASFWGDKNVLTLDMVMAAQLYEYIKTIYSKWVNCMVCELCLNKAAKKAIYKH